MFRSNVRVLVEHPAKEKSRIWAMQFSRDDKYFAIGNRDGQIKVFLIFFGCIPSDSLTPLSRYGILQKDGYLPCSKGMNTLSSPLIYLQMADFLCHALLIARFASGVCVMGYQGNCWTIIYLPSTRFHSVRMDDT